MLTIILLSNILTIIIAIVRTIDVEINRHGSRLLHIVTVVALITVVALTGLTTYLFLVSRNPLSIIAANFWWALLFTLITSFYSSESSFSRYGVPAVLAIVGVVAIGGEIHSTFAVKPSANSIRVENKASSKAPTFKKDVTPIALTTATVKNRMNKSMSDVPHSQYYELGEIQAQYYKGKAVYVASVEIDGLFRQSASHRTSPGYFIIDATNVNATPKFVKTSIKYSNGAILNRNAERKIYDAYPTWLVANGSSPQLEIDENGTPYYVQTMYKSEKFSHKVNYSKLHAVTLNAQTGETKLYSLNSLPSWIDEGITTEVANSMNKYFGKFTDGWFNAHFSKTNVKNPTNDQVKSTFNSKGQIEYFTDFTNPSSKSDSALGYSMINARTGKLTFYKTNGVMDSDGAKKNADNNYKAQKWSASMPIIYNIDGRPTWVLSILDSTKAFRGYYYIDAADQSVYATGNNANDTLDSYREVLSSSDVGSGNTSSIKAKNITGTVDRVIVANSSKSGQIMMFTFTGNNVIYTVDGSDYKTSLLTKYGDEVTVKAKVSDGAAIGNVTEFKNKNLGDK